MSRSSSFCGLVLAAGASSRMGRDKALLPWRGTTFVESALRALSDTDIVIVVSGANRQDLEPVVYGAGGYVIENPDPARGQFSSLRIGLQEILNRGRDTAVITLVDRPAPERDTVRVLQQAFLDSSPDIWALVPEYEGRHGHPFIAGREMIEAFLRAPADSTAREVEHANQQHIRYLPVSDPLVACNVDTPEEYERILHG